MEIIYLLIGIAIGGIAIGFISTLVIKSKTVSKSEFDAVTHSFNEARTSLMIEQERTKQLTEKQSIMEVQHSTIAGENSFLQSSIASYKANLDAAKETINLYIKDVDQLKQDVKSISNEFYEANKRVAELTANNRALMEKLETQKEEMEGLAKKFNTEFENIANKILDDKTQKFTKQNKENLETILKPLGDNIDQFKKKVEEVYDKESKERFSLGKEVEKLVELNNKISEEANNLTKALKGSSKKQGDWGQMILENILEQSGLVKDREYFVQEFLKDDAGNFLKNDEGKKMQPDVIVAYPDNRKVIIDSKVSLNAYVAYNETEDPDEQKRALHLHLKSMRSHIEDLSMKSYQDFTSSLDFVMMFVPNEPAYLLALQGDSNLWQYAYKKRILLISPTNLIAALKLIVDLWKREYQNQNALAIAERGAALYDKFVGFVDNLSKVGAHLENTKKSYDAAYGQLKAGSGNLIGQAEKLRELGVKAKKTLPTHLVTDALLDSHENGMDE